MGAGLGVIELTVALHAVFQAPEDKLIWDVSHQSYPHKILTGRRAKMRSLRQKDGISGFTKRMKAPMIRLVLPFQHVDQRVGLAVAGDLGGQSETGYGDAIA